MKKLLNLLCLIAFSFLIVGCSKEPQAGYIYAREKPNYGFTEPDYFYVQAVLKNAEYDKEEKMLYLLYLVAKVNKENNNKYFKLKGNFQNNKLTNLISNPEDLINFCYPDETVLSDKCGEMNNIYAISKNDNSENIILWKVDDILNNKIVLDTVKVINLEVKKFTDLQEYKKFVYSKE